MIKAEEFYQKYLNIDLPYCHQKKVWENLQTLKFPLLLKAPTGSGKTEAVLSPFLAQFVYNKFHIAPRLIYVLPMRVLVNSVAARIKKYADRISPNISVKVQHGDLPNSPFFIADIVVTTLDQFLYGFARASRQVGRHLDMPAGSIASSLVVFDEAHMYRDGFTFSIMRALICSFVNETLDYQANDYEARDTLIDLYECVLYADERPTNIQLRDGKPITLVVVDLSSGKKEERVKEAIQQGNSIDVDVGVGWKLLKDGILKYKLNFNEEKRKRPFEEVKDVSPFSYYLLEKDNYDQLKGIIPDASSYII